MTTHGNIGKQYSMAERYAALNRIGTALMSELDESRLLHLIAETACELTGASFAAFTLRPVDDEGLPLVPSEGNLFHLAAVVGVTEEQKELFRRMPLGGEGLLAPIFRYGVPVLVDDALAYIAHGERKRDKGSKDAARDAAFAFAHGAQPSSSLQAIGVPRGHPMIRSFLGVPLLDHERQVRGGLLLGHPEPGQFTEYDQTLLAGLAGQAAVAMENARLYKVVEKRAIERRILAETEARRALLQTILDQLPSSVYLVRGVEARLVLANRAAAAVFGAQWTPGKSMSEFLNENGIRLYAIDGHQFAPTQFATIRAVKLGETVLHHQEIIRHADGTSLPVLVNAVALSSSQLNLVPDGAGEEPAAIVVHQDVRAMKEAEALKDEFIGIAAHELRNPLAVLRGFAQTLIVQTGRGKGAELADWQLEALEGIDQATVRLTELTEDLLDVTRLQAGRLELHIEPTDLVALTRRVVARLQMTDEHHPIIVTTACEHIVASLDPRRIEQVLNNIIGNAIKYSPEGGPVEVTLSEDPAKKHAIVSVRDRGIGIPASQQARIFSRFTRADNARRYGIGGTGLGLYLCRELVERHQGRIWFESAEGQGSTFYIAMPCDIINECI